MQFINCTQNQEDNQSSVVDVPPEPIKPTKPSNEKIKIKQKPVPK